MGSGSSTLLRTGTGSVCYNPCDWLRDTSSGNSEVEKLWSENLILICISPKKYVDYDKGNRLRASPYIRNPPPPACAVRHSQGMGPLTNYADEVQTR
jgi:hypothetical protein